MDATNSMTKLSLSVSPAEDNNKYYYYFIEDDKRTSAIFQPDKIGTIPDKISILNNKRYLNSDEISIPTTKK